MCLELEAAVVDFFAGLELDTTDRIERTPVVPELVHLADFAARCRSPVRRDHHYSRHIQLVPRPEIGARLYDELAQHASGLLTIGRGLEDLTAHGVLYRAKQGKGLADLWSATTWARERWNVTVPGKSSSTKSEREREDRELRLALATFREHPPNPTATNPPTRRPCSTSPSTSTTARPSRRPGPPRSPGEEGPNC